MAIFDEATGVRLDPVTVPPPPPAAPAVKAQDSLPDKGETVPQKQPIHNQGGKR